MSCYDREIDDDQGESIRMEKATRDGLELKGKGLQLAERTVRLRFARTTRPMHEHFNPGYVPVARLCRVARNSGGSE